MSDTALAGIAFVTIDGSAYDLVGDLAYFAIPIKRESLTGQDKVHGFKETPQPCYMAFTLRDNGGLTVADLNAMRSSTVTAQLANGKTVAGSDLWSTEVEQVETMEGTFKVKFEGRLVVEYPA